MTIRTFASDFRGENAMLEILTQKSKWSPPKLEDETIKDAIESIEQKPYDYDYLCFLSLYPYIDFLELEIRDHEVRDIRRFTLCEEYFWEYEQEEIFENRILKRDYPLHYKSSCFDEIFEIYSDKFPGWHLKKYLMRRERLLDHIHHCMKRNTIKELLYKAGLDELAAMAPKMYEINLLSSTPSEIYDGVPNRVIRAVNTEYGAKMLLQKDNREFLKKLNSRYPDVFKEALNDAQCEYLIRLKEGGLEWDEINRLFSSSRKRLSAMWIHAQFSRFILKGREHEAIRKKAKELIKVDPIYGKYLSSLEMDKISELEHYLIDKREELNQDIRRSNRKRNADWQYRDSLYVIRYPQTINDICREAVYMSNCLLTYLEAFVENDTDILLMRKADDVNTPFITLEIYQNTLLQAYHRFNRDCNEEEAEWIRGYCRKHEIYCEDYKFNWDLDRR